LFEFLCKIIGSWAPDYVELTLFASASDPFEAHVGSLVSSLERATIAYVYCNAIIAGDLSGQLRVPEQFEVSRGG
jgi:hypothetical protein